MARFAKTDRLNARISRALRSKLEQLARLEARARKANVTASTVACEILEAHVDERLQPLLNPAPVLQTA